MPVTRPLVAIFVLVVGLGSAIAADPTARSLVSADTAVMIEIYQPLQLVENPLANDLWKIVRESYGIKLALTSPEVDRFRQAAKFIEKSLGTDWRTGIGRLTTGGIVVAIKPQPAPAEPAVTVIVTAADEQTLKQFIDAVQTEIHRAAASLPQPPAERTTEKAGDDVANEVKSRAAESTSYRSFICHRVGNGHFSVVGRQLVVANTKSGLEGALDRLARAATTSAFNPPASLRMVDVAGKSPVILATANLKAIRQDPQIQERLQFPSNEPLAVAVIGGYLDLFRRADFAAAGLFVDGAAYDLKVRFPVGTDGAFAGLRGYFASEASQSAPQLLRPTGTIFTAGWFRDYNKMWDARRELFNPDVVKKLEADNAREKSEGAKVGLEDILKLIGPQFRFVAARPQESVYQVKLDERLPACGLVVSVRDEAAFRQRVLAAVDSLLWLGVSSSNLGEIKSAEYRGAKINTVRFTERPEITDPEKLVLYNFDPSYSLTRRELIVGSTSEIVRHLIDELDRQAAAPETDAPGPDRVTDQQTLFFAEISEFLSGYRARMVGDAVRNRRLAPAEAEKEVELLHQVLNRVGNLTTSNTIADDHFDINLRLGPIILPQAD